MKKMTTYYTPAQAAFVQAVHDASAEGAAGGVTDGVRSALAALGEAGLAAFDSPYNMMCFCHTPLELALMARNWALCDFLVEQGADPNRCLIHAAKTNDRVVLDRLRMYPGTDVERAKHDMFVWAVLEGHFELAEELLAMGADIHHTPNPAAAFKWRDYALFSAAAVGDDDIVRWLLQRGADADVNRDKILEVTRERGLLSTRALFLPAVA